MKTCTWSVFARVPARSAREHEDTLTRTSRETGGGLARGFGSPWLGHNATAAPFFQLGSKHVDPARIRPFRDEFGSRRAKVGLATRSESPGGMDCDKEHLRTCNPGTRSKSSPGSRSVTS
jgi:hypothetical protein